MKTISQTNNKNEFLDILINPYNYKEKIIPIEYCIAFRKKKAMIPINEYS
jgi:hypothetical protein